MAGADAADVDQSLGFGRREVLRAGAAAATLAAGTALVAAAPPALAATRSPSPVTPTRTVPRPWPPLSADPVLHLLRRATFGPTPALAAEVRRLGTRTWLEQQLAPSTVDDRVCAGYLARYPRLGWTIPQVRAALGNGGWDVMFDLGQAAVVRAVWSRRQLFEVMVDFWSNHLNVTNPSSEVWESRHLYDRDVIRKHAMGRFADMLVASAMHPSMLQYLNNAESNAQNPNENYGRELLELHTVGVDAGYTEQDMHQSALAMTGLTVYRNWRDQADPRNGTFQFRPDWHHVGPLRVMGWSSPNSTAAGGQQVAVSYLTYLARHPATARRIADKLVQRFVSDTPRPVLADQLAKVYLANDTRIVPVLRALFTSADFAVVVGRKTRRPMEDVVATLRVLGAAPDASGTAGIQSVYWMLGGMGHTPLAWHPPNGYPDVAVAWASSTGTLARWNAHLTISAKWWPNKLQVPALATFLPSPLPATHGAMVQALAQRLLMQPLPSYSVAAICTFLGVTPSTALKATDAAVTWRLPYVVALVLDSPVHAMR